MNLTHLDENHKPKMVDVSDKKETKRKAIASGKITMSEMAFKIIESDKNKKGPVLQTAVISAIMGAKKTHEIIPMCHPLMLSGIECDIKKDEENYIYKLIVSVKNSGQTGVEMEALTATSIGLLTIYDMVKAIDKSMIISDIMLESKSGGKNGDFEREKV